MDETRSMLKAWLKARGFRVIEAKDGKEAVAAAKREHPALILMDIGIGPQSGLASVSQIREEKGLRRIPVVALTAYDSPGLRLEAKTVGFSEYVTKPFDPNLLGALIDRLLKKKQQLI